MPYRVATTNTSGPRRACLECRRRKIKCTRSFPCAYCVRTRIQCTYPPSRPARNLNATGLEARVERIECTFQSLEETVTEIRELLHSHPLFSSTVSNGQSQEQSEKDACYDSPSGSAQLTCSESLNGSFWLVSSLEPGLTETSLVPLHPPSDVVLFIWQRYLDVVDPVLKIFHVPTVQRKVVEVIRDRSNLSVSTDCLMYAIYYSSVVAMPAEDCWNELHEDKTAVLERYRTGVEHALSRADLFKSLDMTVLQAFVLYLVCGRNDENGPDVYKLVGLAIGTAMKIGLHLDGASQGTSPFNVEMRRRLWWHICTLDVRTAEDHGSYDSDPTILESTFTTKFPLNVNDASLDPNMCEQPKAQSGRTEMLFSLVRFEVSHFTRRVLFSDTFCRNNSYPVLTETQKCKAIDEFRERIEKQYLSYCDKGIPLNFVTAASSRLILVRLKLAICKSLVTSTTSSTTGRDQGMRLRPRNYRTICKEVLQRAQILRQYRKGNQWLWLFQTYVECDALAFLLLDLCVTPPPGETDSEEVWKVIDETYQYWKSHHDIRRDRHWKNIEELRLQALVVLKRGQSTHQEHHSTSSNSSTSSTTSEQSGAAATDNDLESPGSHYNIQQQDPSNFTTDRNPTTDQSSLMREDIYAAAVTPAAHPPPEDTPSDSAEAPGAGTACEWSAETFERYWEIAGSGSSAFVSWL